jgi:hypothetical protein
MQQLSETWAYPASTIHPHLRKLIAAYSTIDMSERIEAQVERFAPGFRGRGASKAGRLRWVPYATLVCRSRRAWRPTPARHAASCSSNQTFLSRPPP